MQPNHRASDSSFGKSLLVLFPADKSAWGEERRILSGEGIESVFA